MYCVFEKELSFEGAVRNYCFQFIYFSSGDNYFIISFIPYTRFHFLSCSLILCQFPFHFTLEIPFATDSDSHNFPKTGPVKNVSVSLLNSL